MQWYDQTACLPESTAHSSLKMTNVDGELQIDTPFPSIGKFENAHNFGKRKTPDGNSGETYTGGEHDQYCEAAASMPVVERLSNEKE